MAQNFQQQQGGHVAFCIPRSAATPQHGQKAAPPSALPKVPRSFQPRPGH